MTRFAHGLHRYWFAPTSPAVLALTRIVVCTYLLLTILPRDVGRFKGVSARPTEFMDRVAVVDLLPIPFPLPPEVLSVFGPVVGCLALAAALGICTRPALLLFAIAYWYMGAAISAWGYVTHSRILPLQVLVILAFAPGTTAWSVDRLLSWLRQRRAGGAAPMRSVLGGSPVPRWGVQLMVVVFAVLLFSAGISKLRHAGWDWADGQTLGFYLSRGAVTNILGNVPAGVEQPNSWRDGFVQFVGREGSSPDQAWKDGVGLDGYLYLAGATPLGELIVRSSWTLIALSIFTLLIELAAPLLLFNHAVRSVYLLAACGLFVGIWMSMGISFMPWIVVALCLVDWRRIAGLLAAAVHGQARPLRERVVDPLARLR